MKKKKKERKKLEREVFYFGIPMHEVKSKRSIVLFLFQKRKDLLTQRANRNSIVITHSTRKVNNCVCQVMNNIGFICRYIHKIEAVEKPRSKVSSNACSIQKICNNANSVKGTKKKKTIEYICQFY